MPGRHSASTPPRPHTTYTFPRDPGIPLACPVCRTALFREDSRLLCRGAECRRAYAIRDGIPLLLESESTVLNVEDWQKHSGKL